MGEELDRLVEVLVVVWRVGSLHRRKGLELMVGRQEEEEEEEAVEEEEPHSHNQELLLGVGNLEPITP